MKAAQGWKGRLRRRLVVARGPKLLRDDLRPGIVSFTSSIEKAVKYTSPGLPHSFMILSERDPSGWSTVSFNTPPGLGQS